MPYISDDELLDFQVKIDEAKEEKRAINFSHNKALRDEQEKTHKFKIATIILGILALLGVAGTVYLMAFSDSGNVISQTEHDAQIDHLKDKITSLEETVQGTSIEKELDTQTDETKNTDSSSLENEIVYSVQIGAFEERDLSMYSDNYVNFKEIKKGEYNKYALGNFESLDEAKGFRRELIKIGFRDAFIASYQNGERLRIEEAW